MDVRPSASAQAFRFAVLAALGILLASPSSAEDKVMVRPSDCADVKKTKDGGIFVNTFVFSDPFKDQDSDYILQKGTRLADILVRPTTFPVGGRDLFAEFDRVCFSDKH